MGILIKCCWEGKLEPALSQAIWSPYHVEHQYLINNLSATDWKMKLNYLFENTTLKD